MVPEKKEEKSGTGNDLYQNNNAMTHFCELFQEAVPTRANDGEQ